MQKHLHQRLFALMLCLALLLAGIPVAAHAEATDTELSMTEGDVIASFAAAGAACTSSDPSVAWVDENGSLNALREGTATVTVADETAATEYTVTVEDYTDGTPVAGNLKILARYNDNMQFYDGHVYLLFTSYQDGVEINVPDLYAGYEIADEYYDDIRSDISAGSNHTGTDAERYFKFNDEMTSVTLNRGEIVTIGMYRDFDLSVPQAALGSIKNSSAWTDLVKAGKAGVIENIFAFLTARRMNTDEALDKIKAVIEETGTDYNKVLDGVVDGGVCFNRELYNQKLEWDQFENVTYELDITEKQLATLTAYLGGNLNKFSILKNSCATVALRAWNAAVGTKDDAPSAYYLTSVADGIFSVIDAPKGVRDNIRKRLPGYCLNNAEGVAEPDAGFEDETGWVYVSAPEYVEPAICSYLDDDIRVDESMTKIATLIGAAKEGTDIAYGKEAPVIGIGIDASSHGDTDVINGVQFDINGTLAAIDRSNLPEDGIWFSVKVEEPVAGEDYYVTDRDGKAYASRYEDGRVSFLAEELPVEYKIVGSSEGAQNLLKTTVENGDKVDAETVVYVKDGADDRTLESIAQVQGGTEIYVRADIDDRETGCILRDITLNGVSFFDDAHYNAEEKAYVTVMPNCYASLKVTYVDAYLTAIAPTNLQLGVGDTLTVADVAALHIGSEPATGALMKWDILDNTAGAVEINGSQLTGVTPGAAVVWVCAEGNENIGVICTVSVYENAEDMAKVTYSAEVDETTIITASYGDEEPVLIPYSGYLVKKGSVLDIRYMPPYGKAALRVSANGNAVAPGDVITVDADTEIAVRYATAEIKNLPEEIYFTEKGNAHQLEATVANTGIYSLLPAYDPTVGYEALGDIITVDETGLVTLVGDVPEEGAVAYVKAYSVTNPVSVSKLCRVVIGDYAGDQVVGRLTISARRIYAGQLVAHAALTFTTYQDVDMDVSYYEYNKPNDKFYDLMIDYELHPENYAHDPALYNENELGLEDRRSFFDNDFRGELSEPVNVSLLAGESISISNYGFDDTILSTIRKALEGSSSDSREVQAVIEEMRKFEQGEEIDSVVAFDGLLATIKQMYAVSEELGFNPADGHSVGGMVLDREIYNQFRRDDSQFPNNYYTVEITADELEILKTCLKNPENNYYNLFNKNCASGAIHIWNDVLSDTPELQLKGNLTGLANDPESLYFELGLLNIKKKLDIGLRGNGGTDFYPRTVRYTEAVSETIALIDAIGEVDYTEECKDKIDAARAAYDALNDVQKERVHNLTSLELAEAFYNLMEKNAQKEAFEDYKSEKLAAIDALAGEDDSEGKQKLINDAKAALEELKYDDEKTLEENKDTVDAILEDLDDALAMQEKEDAFTDYQAEKIAEIDGMAGENDSLRKKALLSLAKLMVNLQGYDHEKSLDENKAAVDNIMNRLTEVLNEMEPASKGIKGDVDGDGKVDVFDASAIQKGLAGAEGFAKYSELEKDDPAFLAADVDGNGTVDVFDASLIQKWMAGDTAAQQYGIGEAL